MGKKILTNTKKKVSIKFKLIFIFAVLIMVSSISLGLSTVNLVSNITIEEANENMQRLSEKAAMLEASRLETGIKKLELLVTSDQLKEMNWSEQVKILDDFIEGTDFEDIGVIDSNWTLRYHNGEIVNIESNHPVRMLLEKEEKANVFTTSKVNNKLSLIQAIPILKNGKMVGALVGRSRGDMLSEIVADTGFGKKGYAYIIDGNGTFIGYRDQDYVLNQFTPTVEVNKDKNLSSLADSITLMLENKSGTDDYMFEGTKRYVGYAPIEGTDWIFVMVGFEDEILDAIPLIRSSIIFISLIVLAISILLTYIIGLIISKPILETSQIADQIAQNMGFAYNNQKLLIQNDEIGSLAQSLDSIINNLRNIIGDIQTASEHVASSSEELTATSEETAAASQEVAKTVEEIAHGATEQAKNTETGSLKAIELGNTIEEVQSYILKVNDYSNNVKEVVSQGLTEIDLLSEKTQESTTAVQEIYDVIMKTNESSNKIGEASNVIESIAAQTNLLSLNAAIEAARAGDAGRGFAVVAEEIRTLAEQSASSTKIIHDIVNELRANINDAVNTMQKVTAISAEQANSVNSNKDKYNSIEKAMNLNIDAVFSLSRSGEQMDLMRQEIVSILENLSAIAEENAAASQEASAATEEQTAAVEEISGTADYLSDLANELHMLIEKFKI